MSDIKQRAKLRPRATSVLDALASKVTANDVAEPNKAIEQPVATDEFPVQTEQKSAETMQGNDIQETETVEPSAESVQSDPVPEESDWLSSLTVPDSTPQPTATVSQPVYTADIPEPEAPPAQEQSPDYYAAVAEQIKNLSTVDPEVAEELFHSVFAPAMEQFKRNELEQMRRQVEEQQVRFNQIEQQKVQSVSDRVDAEIMKHYSRDQASRILKSVEFAEFLDKELPPYASENGYDILKRAYTAGDASYVISAMDRFKGSRVKPKPQVNADVSSGGTTVAANSHTKPKMTQAEYLAKRKAIMSAPRGTYPANALAKLVEQFTKGGSPCQAPEISPVRQAMKHYLTLPLVLV